MQSITAPQKAQKIVIDAGNGVSGLCYPDIFETFGHEVISLYCDLDTSYPHHQPDPERPENLVDALALVDAKKADFGFVFDGDGDRLGIVLPGGVVLSADKILYILAADFLTRHPGAKIVVDAMSSQALIQGIKARGGEVIVSPTGHSHIEHALKTHQSLLGGEQSGHFMFGEDFYGHDDACLAGLRFLSALENDPHLLQKVTTDWPKLIEYSEKVEVEEAQKFEILERVKTELLQKFPQAQTMDGIRIDFGNLEWAIIRCSNTSAKIALRIEAVDAKSLKEKTELLSQCLDASL